MRMRTVAGALALLLVLAIAGGIAYIKSIDPNQYKGYIVQQAKAATGRDLKLEGPISLAIGWSPALVVEGASFSNASWGTRPEMARLRRLEVEVELWPLLSRDIRLKRLVLVGPDILLETDRQGRGNWMFGEPGAGGGAGGGLPAGLSVSLRLEDGLVTYRDGQTGEVQKLAIERMTTRAEGLEAPVTLDLKGAYMDLPLRAKGKVGALGRILGSGGTFPLDIQASLAGVEAQVKGEIGNLQKMSGVRLAVSASAASLAALKPIAGEMAASLGKLSFSAEVKGGPDIFQADNLKLALGGTDLAGKAGVNLKGAKPLITAELASKRAVLADFLGAPEGGKAAGGGQKKSAARKGKVFPNDPLPLDALGLLDADVRYTAGEVVAPGATLREVAARLVLRGGKLSVQPFTAKVAGGEAAGGLSLDAGTKAAAAGMKVKGLELGALLKEAGHRDWVSGRADLAVDLKGRGASVAAIMASLNGETKFVMANGRASTAGLDYAIGGFTQVLGTLLSKGTDKVALNCAVSDFLVRDGVATSRALVVDSEFSTIAGEGKIDLGRETLDMKVTPRPKSATLNLSVPVNIQGTLANPKVRPDELAVARRLGGIAGIFIFPPAAIAGLGDLGSADNPCLKLMAAPGQPPAKQPTSAAGKAAEELKKGVEGIGQGLKGLFGR
ncbi:MAG: AsmA family protein [Candidatus Tectomicrobia bacterium]|uniref:AsmA family protein n=1 Tax=Tectimicrobiota bacterium TaxID=2528274 RepID=A0A932I243_UNCTE|nr:AsmA family protein [Candidatus Tectomicrobia bacterium]